MTDHKTANMSIQETIAVELGRPATYQDVLDAPEHKVAEIIEGTFYLSPRPAPLHAVANKGVMCGLAPLFHLSKGGAGGWWILIEPEIHIGDNVTVPDITGWKHNPMPEHPYDTPYFTATPDWVCETLSATTRSLDLDWKRPLYAREGVGHLWLVDPIDRTLEAFELRDGEWVPIAALKGDEPVSVPPFETITFSLGDLWWPEAPTDESNPTNPGVMQ